MTDLASLVLWTFLSISNAQPASPSYEMATLTREVHALRTVVERLDANGTLHRRVAQLRRSK